MENSEPEAFASGRAEREARVPALCEALKETLAQLRHLNAGHARCRDLSLAITAVEDAILRLWASINPHLVDA